MAYESFADVPELSLPPPRRTLLGGTPSTATPPSHSFSSERTGSTTDSRSTLSSWGARGVAAAEDPDNAQALRLIQARQKAADSMEALRRELSGRGEGAAARYASWPVGSAVEVPLVSRIPGVMAGEGGVGVVPARLVRYDAAQNAFEVEHRDGSRQVLPAQKVRRVGRGAGNWNSSIVPGRETALPLRT